MSANMFSFGASSTFQTARVWAFNKAQMYAGSPTVKVVSFDVGGGDFTVIPSNARLQTGTPPAGRPNFFVSTWLFINAINIYKFHVDWNNISLSTFSGPTTSMAATSWPNAAVANAPQPGTTMLLDVLQIRAMVQNQYTNFLGAESLWVPHTVRRVNTTGFAAPRWYQANVTGGTVGASLPQATTWDPDGANVIHRFMPSLAVDRAGNMAMGYSTSNATTEFPSIKYAGRLAADPVNTFSQTEQTFFTGTGSQTGINRWGDYSSMTLDPNGCTFWYTNEYANPADQTFDHRWLTKFGPIGTFPGCIPVGAGGTITGTVTLTPGGSPIAGASVDLGARHTTTDGSGVYSFSNIPAGTYPSLSAGKPGFVTSSASTIVVTDSGTTTQNFSLAAAPASSCLTDTTQSDFLTGVSTNLDLNTSPGDVMLSNTPAIDQANTAGTTTGTGFGTPNWTGQTFIPAVTGLLVKADVSLFCNGCGATPPDLTLSVRNTSAGLPTGADLATATIPGSAFASGATTTFTASLGAPTTLTSGTQYALILRPVSSPAGSGYFWIRSSPSTYANGQRVLSADSGATWSADSTRDYNFRTYMQTGFAASGTLVSSPKDSNPAGGLTPIWSSFSWNGSTTPAISSLKFQLAGSNDVNGPFNFVGPDGTAATFFTTSPVSLSPQFYGFRYLEYEAFLATTDGTVTPVLSDATACFNDIDCSGVAATITTPPEVCATSIGNTASGPAGMTGYSWSITNGTITSATNTQSITYNPGASGTVTLNLTVNAPNSCIASNSVPVTIDQMPATPTISGTTNGTGTQDQACPEQPLTLTANGAIGATSYQWYQDANPINGATSQTYQATSAGTYHVTAINGVCMTALSAGYVVQNPTPHSPFISFRGQPSTTTSIAICQGSSQIIDSDSATGIQWYKDGVAIPGAGSQSYTATQSGVYTAQLDALGCHSQFGRNVTVTLNPLPPTPTINAAGPTSFCAGGSVNLSSNSASGNQWYLNGNPIGGATNQNYSATATGNYTVKVTDGNSCTSPTSAPTTVTVNPLPITPTITPGGSTTFCPGGRVNLNSSSASGNQWYLNGNAIGGATGQSYNATASGNYTVTVTDGNGCTSASSSATTVTVNQPAVTVLNTNDSGAGSLRQALIDVCDGGTINFNLPAGPQTITLGSTLSISKTLTISGPSNQAVTINGGGNRIGSVSAGSPNLSNLTFTGASVSGGNGGGLLNTSTGTVTFTGVTFNGNSADNGGAIATTAGTVVINNSTISGNTAATDGGAIYNSGGTITLLNDTMTNNTAIGGQGGGVRNVSGTVNVKNTIIAGNSASSNANVAGTITDQGNNLLSGNPMLGSLANNGGPTMTHLPLPGSLAVNAGDNTAAAALTTDQRGPGFNRIINTTVDIGAVEVNYSITATAGNSQSATINTAFATALQATVKESNVAQNNLAVTFTPPASGASGTFTGGNPASANTNASGIATAPTFTANGTAGGPYNVVASLANNLATVNLALTNTAANQMIVVNTHAPGSAFFNTQFTVAATATSGLPVSYSSAGSCNNSGATFTMTSGTGTCSVIYNQGGNGNFNPAPQVTETVNAQKANQTITFNSITNKTFGDADFSVGPTASSGLPVTLSATGNCTVTTPAPGTVHLTGAGSCTITGKQGGDGNYNAATDMPQSFTIAKSNQTITFNALANKTFGDPDFTVSATASSNLAVTFTASGNCTISTNTVHLTGAGSCTVTAKQGGDSNFNGATDVPRTFTIALAATTTAVSSSVNPSNITQNVTFTATITGPANTGTPTGTVTFKDGAAAISCANAGGQTLNASGVATCQTATLVAGTHVITAVYAGDANFQTSTGTLSPNQVVNNLPLVSFSPANYNVNESDGIVHVIVTRAGDTSVPFNVDYATGDTGASTNCGALNTGLASSRCDFTTTLGTLKFAANQTQATIDITINQDGYLEGAETFTVNLSNPTAGALLVNPATATVTINDSAVPSANAIDDTTIFVRQQYHDFLNREPDAAGLAFWKQNIDQCNDPAQLPPGQTVAQCIETQRIITSAAFFLSIEFNQTGTFVRSFYVAALDRPATNNMPDLREWLRDTQAVQRNVVVGQGDWQATLDANRLAFMQDFVMRPEFVGLYPTTDTPMQYVDKLYQHAGVLPANPAERAAAIAEFGNAAMASDPVARGRALLDITQNPTFQARELLRAFVQMEYFGYLRRNPNDPPDNNFNGYNFWLNKLIQFNGDFLQSEMVKAFIGSIEYRQRFGQ